MGAISDSDDDDDDDVGYNTDDLIRIVMAIHANEVDVKGIADSASTSSALLQALVDIGDTMMKVGYTAARLRGEHLFSPWNTIIVRSDEEG